MEETLLNLGWSPNRLKATKGERSMTREQFCFAISGLPAPFWLAMRNGDQIACSKVFDVGQEHVSILSDQLRRSIHLVDVQSVNFSLQVGSTTPPAPFAPVLAADL